MSTSFPSRPQGRRFTANVIAAIACVFTALSPANAQDALDDLPALPVGLGSIVDQQDPRFNKSMIAPLVSQPVEPDELRDYALVLHLSDEQRVFARDAYLAYRLRTDKLRDTYNEPVATLAHEAADTDAHLYDWEFLRLMTELREVEAKYQKELVEQDRAFLASLQTVLAQPQQERFERVTLRRSRKRCQPFGIHISPGYIDLVDLVQKYIKDPEVLGDLDTPLLEYERLITPLYLDIDATGRENGLKDMRLLVETRYSADGKTFLDQNSPEAQARVPEYEKQRTALLATTIPQQERLADINREFIARLLEVIPVDQSKAMQQEYLRTAFPYIHLDRCDPADLMQTMLATEGLDPDLRVLMQARMDEWRVAYDRMTREMEDHYDKYSRIFARTFSSEAEHTSAIRKLRFERWACSEEAVKSLAAMLPTEAKTAFDRRRTSFEKRLESERENERNPRRGNP